MVSPPFDNPYALLALFLSPCKDSETLGALHNGIQQEKIDWGSLLYQANLHFCTPLWYVRLRQDGLLPHLPEDLQHYLACLHQANVERNAAFRQVLKELLKEFQDHGIASVLLKGAATFCDDLYGDPGARMMGDLDILVEPQSAEKARSVLLRLGYAEGRPLAGSEKVFKDNRHHHLPRFDKPGTPVVVEIHVKIARRQGGRALPFDLAWGRRAKTAVEGMDAVVLSSTHRLLHNTLHALVPDRTFIRSFISLQQLAEFASLAHRYRSELSWNEWFERGAGQRLALEFSVYLAMGHRLMEIPLPPMVPLNLWSRMHVFRFLAAGKYVGLPQTPPVSLRTRIVRAAVRALLRCYYHMKEPVWLWHNLFYLEGVRHIPMRLAYTLHKWTRAA